ncbi:vWA domain-containing protein [Oricola indica]|jgi:Ca-activated chloride channel family protein|uniref:vWA domain-containing protein n=1 Tax=Oricola indica TaxID=2872591 RepID=UPI001CBAFFC1|nr:VWA domain-containing protein [Oricola indica]
MTDEFDLDILKKVPAPQPDAGKRDAAMREALSAFDAEKKSAGTQGSTAGSRLMTILQRSWSTTMTAMTKGRLMSGTAIAGILAVPLAGYLAFAVMNEGYRPGFTDTAPVDFAQGVPPSLDDTMVLGRNQASGAYREAEESDAAIVLGEALPAPMPTAPSFAKRTLVGDGSAKIAPGMERLRRDRFETYETSSVRAVLEDPVSTFSIDVDTASYSVVRRAIMEGRLPDPDSVRVEELINYFNYAYPLPENRSAPFGVNVSVSPTPWNPDTKLMHIGIQGFDIEPENRPAANLVFLIDVSGSMDEADKLPLLKSGFRLLLDKLDERDTISIVTYAGNAGTVLEPTSASERDKILHAIDTLEPGGTTAGAAGIEEAYRLAREARIEGGVNRVMLATDGDFNVGATSDEELKRMIEDRRDDGIFLSVFGFGKGNYNDQLMQVLAQNGNGTAAYIDTLAEAQKTLVEEAGSTLFPIAKDVKIQVEFNPQTVAEYRLIGYETRALKREDFNNDRVDAGDIGSGHSVTAIYEITPVGSPAVQNDPLRYGSAEKPAADTDASSGEYAFLKLRYKLPDETQSHLMTTPIGHEFDRARLASLSTDARFSIAVAAFGQKLRDTDAVADYSWDEIRDLAAGARGEDPFGYRSEFLRLVGLAESLDR